MFRFLIIQTAFIGDVVLATAVAEKLHNQYPEAEIDFLLRKGNEGLLKGHPFIKEVLIWNKQEQKQLNLVRIINKVRKKKYTHVFNLHRFATSGIITWLSGAKYKAGFDKNPFAFCYNKKVSHIISEPYTDRPIHETERNQAVIADLTDDKAALPKLYPSREDFEKAGQLARSPYICIAPSSVWYTKQFPKEKWVDLTNQLSTSYHIYLLGAKSDRAIAAYIHAQSGHPYIVSLCGELNFLESAALMKHAAMNYVNDSAPMHFASAVNAPVTAVYCSTVPAFGFGPLSEQSIIAEVKERLYCRPCGLHGHKACPEGHFRCALDITNKQLLEWTSNRI